MSLSLVLWARRPTRFYAMESKLSANLCRIPWLKDDDEAAEIWKSGKSIEKAACSGRKDREKIIIKESCCQAREISCRKTPEGLYQKAIVRGRTKVYCARASTPMAISVRFSIDMHKEASGFRRMMEQLLHRHSVGLQYGVPLEEFVESFTFTKLAQRHGRNGKWTIKNANLESLIIFSASVAVSLLGPQPDLAACSIAPKVQLSMMVGRAEQEGGEQRLESP